MALVTAQEGHTDKTSLIFISYLSTCLVTHRLILSSLVPLFRLLVSDHLLSAAFIS